MKTWARFVWFVYALALTLLMFTCPQQSEAAEAAPYVSVEGRYMLELASHRSRWRGGETNGSNPGVNIEAGIEFKLSKQSRWKGKFGLTHDSNLKEGFPFNHNSEDHDTSVFVGFQYGGL